MKYLVEQYKNAQILTLTCINEQCIVVSNEKDMNTYNVKEFLKKYQGNFIIDKINFKGVYEINKDIYNQLNFNIFDIYEILYKYEKQEIFIEYNSQCIVDKYLQCLECLEWLQF